MDDTSKVNKSSYNREELMACARGELFGHDNAQLPQPPMLMIDRITGIERHSTVNNSGELVAELDIKPDMWFFDCHFFNDPVMPGCLGLDAMWQLLGFYLAWIGAPGHGRALGVGDVKFSGQVTPEARLVTYKINIRRVILRKQTTMGIANASMLVDNKDIYTAQELRVGLFKSTKNF